MLLLFPPRYSGTAGIVAMIGLYGLALAFNRGDRAVAAMIPTGGHPWKHIAGAAAMFAYLSTVAHRHRLPPQQVNSRVRASFGGAI